MDGLRVVEHLLAVGVMWARCASRIQLHLLLVKELGVEEWVLMLRCQCTRVLEAVARGVALAPWEGVAVRACRDVKHLLGEITRM